MIPQMIYGLYADAFSSKQDIADAEDKHRGAAHLYTVIYFSPARVRRRGRSLMDLRKISTGCLGSATGGPASASFTTFLRPFHNGGQGSKRTARQAGNWPFSPFRSRASVESARRAETKPISLPCCGTGTSVTIVVSPAATGRRRYGKASVILTCAWGKSPIFSYSRQAAPRYVKP